MLIEELLDSRLERKEDGGIIRVEIAIAFEFITSFVKVDYRFTLRTLQRKEIGFKSELL